MKKRLMITWLILICVFALFACSTPFEQTHICNYGDWITVKEATAAEEGLKERACECGETETEIIPICLPDAPSLEFTLNSDGLSYMVTGVGSYTDTNVSIPAIYNGKPVIAIGDGAFYQCSSFTSIEIPDSITSIGFDAFDQCSSLTTINIPSSVTNIGAGAFSRCESLVDIYVSENNRYYDSIDGNLYSEDGKTLIQYAIGKTEKSFDIPYSVINIGDYAFCYSSSLENVKIPYSVTNIGKSAFYDCISLTSIEIPDSVTSIGDGAFAGCESLVSVTIPQSIRIISVSAFAGCESLTSVTISNSVKSIADSAFYNCKSLINITYEGTVEEWDLVDKGSDWNTYIENYTVYCTNGTVSKDGTVTYK